MSWINLINDEAPFEALGCPMFCLIIIQKSETLGNKHISI